MYSILSWEFLTQLRTLVILDQNNRKKCIIIRRQGYWQQLPGVTVLLVSKTNVMYRDRRQVVGADMESK